MLVTDVDVPIEAVAQLNLDRADAENAFDELKNQWGLGATARGFPMANDAQHKITSPQDQGFPVFRLAYLALLCLLIGCSGTAPRHGSGCIPGNPGGSIDCQVATYATAR